MVGGSGSLFIEGHVVVMRIQEGSQNLGCLVLWMHERAIL